MINNFTTPKTIKRIKKTGKKKSYLGRKDGKYYKIQLRVKKKEEKAVRKIATQICR